MKLSVLTYICFAVFMFGDGLEQDMKKLQGTWKLIHDERDGEKKSEEVTREDPPWVFKADKLIIGAGASTYRLDAAKKPKTIDVTPDDAEARKVVKTLLGIYSIESDTLKIALSMKERPKEFATKKGSGVVLVILKRERR
jgi:uncharacterized protein (TIGR03067 family)